ncbi:hypothetical protein M514_01824, partial [Trichuris suis]
MLKQFIQPQTFGDGGVHESVARKKSAEIGNANFPYAESLEFLFQSSNLPKRYIRLGMLSKKWLYLYTLTALSTACPPKIPEIGKGLYCIEADIQENFQNCLIAEGNLIRTVTEKALLNDFLEIVKETPGNKLPHFCRIFNRANVQCFKDKGGSQGIKAHISAESSLTEKMFEEVFSRVKNDDDDVRYKFTELQLTKGMNCCD